MCVFDWLYVLDPPKPTTLCAFFKEALVAGISITGSLRFVHHLVGCFGSSTFLSLVLCLSICPSRCLPASPQLWHLIFLPWRLLFVAMSCCVCSQRSKKRLVHGSERSLWPLCQAEVASGQLWLRQAKDKHMQAYPEPDMERCIQDVSGYCHFVEMLFGCVSFLLQLNYQSVSTKSSALEVDQLRAALHKQLWSKVDSKPRAW